MFRISKDSSAYYLTSVARDRLPVFRLEDEPLVLDLDSDCLAPRHSLG